ncbi:MAG TPA: YIP1 family protein [Spirochaetota bacterium]|nr:YIP1 family protein [Spirochaetota bacterium]HPJ36410.1 YIP1 family protein [Spirochaetota bacterium]
MKLESFRTLAWADFFLYSMIDPRALYRRIKQKEPDPFWISFIVPASVSLSGILTISLMGRESAFFYYKLSYGWIFVFLYTFLKTVIYASLIDVAAQFSGLKGNIREVISSVNFSMLPELFILPAAYPFIVGDFIPLFFYVLFSLVCFVWHVLILVQAISEMHIIDFGKAFLIYIMPAVFTGIVFILMAVMFFINALGYFSSIM